MRLFVGIPLVAAVIDELQAATSRLRAARDGLRWSAPATWHVTLQFLGNTTEEQFACVVERLRAVHAPPVRVSLEALDCFDRAGVLIVGVRLTPELLLLQERVTEAAQPCGFVPETRPYQPHITLARSKGKHEELGKVKAKLLHQPKFTRFAAHEFLLYESFLDAGGARYEVRERFSLGRDQAS
jgi:2'-5' RNA ligase